MTASNETAAYISGLIERARKAQALIEFATQEEVDKMAARIGRSGVEENFSRELAKLCADDSGMGKVEDKYLKIQNKIRGALTDMKDKKSVGIVYNDITMGIKKIAKPMGVIGAVMPVTNSEATPFVKILNCIKTRNAIVMAPHPRTLETNKMIADRVRKVLRDNGWPQDLVINVDELSLEATKELMHQCDMALATGGGAMVGAAYSSGTPSQGVGAGNAVCIVDETANLNEAADQIMRSKTFDNATSCSTENSVCIQEEVYHKMVGELEAAGGYFVSSQEKKKMKIGMWDQERHTLNPNIVAQPAEKIAEICGISLPKGKTFFMIEEDGIGKEHPFSGEKLSVTMAIYKWKKFSEAIGLVNEITKFSGAGHSCGIHTTNEDRIEELGEKVKVSRMMVRQPQCLANSGGWTNGMPMTMTLGCGTWGGNSTTSNITWEHLLNYTWISYPIPSRKPTDEELFGEIMLEKEGVAV